jgi:hypothetical protein
MEYTMLKQLQINFIYPDNDYPNCNVAVKLRSKTMPHKLVDTLVRKCENMVKKLATTPDGEWLGKP